MNLTPKSLKLKKVPLVASRYEGRPFWMTSAVVYKWGEYWFLRVTRKNDDGEVVDYFTKCFFRMKDALTALELYGDTTKVKTTNILNPAAGEFDIDLRSKGSCCDPGTERYHSM